MDANKLKVWISIITGILAIIGYLTVLFKWLRKIVKKYILSPEETSENSVVILYENTEFPQSSTWWHMGTNNNMPGMQVSGAFLITNNLKK